MATPTWKPTERRRSAVWRKAVRAQSLLVLAGLAGCTGPQQDVRVSFCKDMVAAHLNALDSIWWVSDGREIKRPEYARIDLGFQIGDSSGAARQAACYYAYDTADENVITQVDPLSAYATTPYRMQVDGQALAEPVLKRLVTDVGLLQGGEFLDRFWKWWREFTRAQ